jgi:hypothetical protein
MEMEVVTVAQAYACNLRKTPWVEGVAIKSIKKIADDFFKVTLVDGRSKESKGSNAVESLKFRKPQSEYAKNYEPKHSFKDCTPEDYRDYNWTKRGGWGMGRNA